MSKLYYLLPRVYAMFRKLCNQTCWNQVYPAVFAAVDPRHAVVNTRHRTRSGRLDAAVYGGDQDADIAPEPLLAEPAPPSTAALRSVGDDDGGVVQEPVQDADGSGLFGQKSTPLLERPVRADGKGSAFVGSGDEPEQ